jgi:hypothetical protein
MGVATMLLLLSSEQIDHNWHVWLVTVQMISPAAFSNGDDTTNLHRLGQVAKIIVVYHHTHTADTPESRVVTAIDGTCRAATGEFWVITSLKKQNMTNMLHNDCDLHENYHHHGYSNDHSSHRNH